MTLKDWLAEKKLPGTIRFYGTPAEEGGDGKLYMIRAGAFCDVDTVLSWHPSDHNGANLKSSLALISAKFRSHGKPAHASSAPQSGRSALDGLMIMATAVELLREHVPDSTRIHYVNMPVLDGIWERIIKCALAGAPASETRMEMELINSSYNTLPNDSLADLVDRNFRLIGGVNYTPEEQRFAESIRRTIGEGAPPIGGQEKVEPPVEGRGGASTDAGDVSSVLPMAEVNAATFVTGVPPHTWGASACAPA